MNIRESRSIHSRIVGQVNKGVQFRIIKEAPDSNPLYSWYLIKTKSGISGWLCGIYKGVQKYAPVAKLSAQEYETKKSLKSSPEYQEEFEDEPSNLSTRLKESLNQLFNKMKMKADKYSIQDKIEQIQISTAKFFSIRRDDRLAFDLLFGSLLTMALYHFCFFGLHRKDISTLYFGCLCILTAFLYTASPERFFIALFPNLDLEIATKIKFICVYLSFTLFVMFINKLYPQELSQIVLRGSQGLGVLFTLLTLVTSAKIHTYVIVAYEVIVVVSSIYLICVLIRASLRKKISAIWLLGGFSFLIITIINDVLFDQSIIHTGRFVPFGVFIFLFAQWYIVSYRFSKSFGAEEQIGAYSRFVPKEFLKKLDKEDISDVKLGDNAEMTMSILFSDIRNFTTLSEQMTPEENFKFINSYLKVMGPVIRRHHGFIDKFIGDAIMALYDTSADDAVRGAIGMLQKLVEYNEGRKRAGYVPIGIGIGINRGSLRIGTVGETGRMEGTVISDAVNVASRIEGMTKMYGVSLLISDETYRSLEDPSKYYTRKIGRVKVKGKKEPVTLWEVFDCDPPDILDYKLNIATIFDEALSLYLSNQFEEAQDLFQDCLVKNPQDKTAQFYKDRCKRYMKMGVDGITRVISYERLVA
jgi:class 3 adenylate cyclase